MDAYCLVTDWDTICQDAYEACIGVLGCLEEGACNYLNGNGATCSYPGCTDSTACNYNPLAACDDGSCQPNEEPDVDITDGFWWMVSAHDDACADWGFGDANFQFMEDGTVVAGVVNPDHPFYGQIEPAMVGTWGMCGPDFFMALTDSIESIDWSGESLGWTDFTGNTYSGTYSTGYTLNFDSWAWDYPELTPGIISGTASNYDGSDDWCFELIWFNPGCKDASACNYDSEATYEDGSCIPSGCTDETACNFNPFAGCDDGSCQYQEALIDLTTGYWISYHPDSDIEGCSTDWTSSYQYVFNLDGTVDLVLMVNPDHAMYGIPQPYGVWGMCADSFFMYATTEEIEVYNMSGELIHEFNPYGNTWTGTYGIGVSQGLSTGSYSGWFDLVEVPMVSGTLAYTLEDGSPATNCFELVLSLIHI